MKKLMIFLMVASLIFLSVAPSIFAVTYGNVGPTTNFDGDVGVQTGQAYYINGVLLSIDDITTEDLIIKADFKDEDWGDLSVSTNVVTIDEDVIDKANFKDEDWGELTVATNVLTIDDDVINIEHFVHSADLGEIAVNAGGTAIEIEDDVIGAEHFADQDWGDVDIASGAATVQDLTLTNETAGDIIYFDGTNWVTLEKDAGKYLKSGAAAVSWDVPAGAGDMSAATYDVDVDGDIDVAAGGTEKSSWTQYAIPYLTDTTAFGEIEIGTAEYCLTVNAGANGYDWTEVPTDTNLTEEEVEDFVGTMVTGNTETGIEVTYTDGGDGAGILNFVNTANRIEHFMDLDAADPDYVHAAIVGTGASQNVDTEITNPDYGRNITVTSTEGSVGVVTITGTTADGTTGATDAITIVDGSIAYGVKAFVTVTNINVSDALISPEEVTIGIGDVIGLSNAISAEADIYKKTVDGVDEFDEISGNGDATYNTLDCATIVQNEDITIYYHN